MAQLVLADWLANSGAKLIGDPNRQRVDSATWLMAYNLAMNDICSIYDIVQAESIADLPSDGLATYPIENTRISEVAANTAPTDPNSPWRVLDEKFQDEYRRLTTGGVPQQDFPEWYFADDGYIRLGARLAADVTGGLRLTYYIVPDEAVDLTTTYMPLPNFMRSYAMERMMIYALRSDDRDEQADKHEATWNQREGWIRQKLEDKSVDRHDAIRPTSSINKYGGMA